MEEIYLDDSEPYPGSVYYDNNILTFSNSDCDSIGAFIGDICVGFRYYGPDQCGCICEIQVMNADSINPKYYNNEVPKFRLFDASKGMIYNSEL